MRMLLMVPVLVAILGFHAANATMRSLTPQEQASTCYPSSPMLYSDACWGQVYTGMPQANVYRTQQGDPFSDIYSLMYALQGQGGLNTNPMAGLNLNPSLLWQNSGMPTTYPALNNAMPMLK